MEFRRTALALGLLASFGISVSGAPQTARARPDRDGLIHAGEAAPAIEIAGGSGAKLSLADARKGGKPVLVYFFFLASDFCRIELPEIERRWTAHAPDDFEVIAIDVSAADSAEAIKRYWAANHLTMPAAPDPRAASAAKAYHVESCPTHYLIGADGKVLSAWVGYPLKTGRARLRAELDKAIATHAPAGG
jgi:peroxiredoxin